ncbi:MAG: DUF1207 domain-containing protein [Bacteroidales bacterium]
MRRYIALVWLLLFLFSGLQPAQAQEEDQKQKYGWIVPLWYGKPLVSEIESPMIKVSEGYGRAREEYISMEDNKNLYAPFLNVSLGTLIPIWSGKINDEWNIGVDLPISFHLWLDLKSQSAPVLNTDYRFAVGQVKALRTFPNNGFLKNISFRFAPYNHESTHIGDELTIRRKNEGFPLTRVNVSYEYSELAVCINDPNATRKNNHALKAGLMVRIPNGKSWFKIYPNEGDTTLNYAMKNLSEFYFEYEFQRTTGWLTSKNVSNVLSLEVRNRARYHYPEVKWDDETQGWYTTRSKHTRSWNYNLYFGWKIRPKFTWYTNSVGFYLNAYYGIVPYGQFRNTPGYSYLGFCIVVEQ